MPAPAIVRSSLRPARRRLRAVTAARGLDGRVTWILGSPRSGSTWLMRLLRGHPDVVTMDEPLIGSYLGPFLSDRPGFDPARLDADRCTVRHAQAHKRDAFFADDFADAWRPALGTLMRRRFAAHVARFPPHSGSVGRAQLVIKEPNGSQSADVLLAALPRSRLLFLLRDGRDVVDSLLAGFTKGAWGSRVTPGLVGIDDEGRLPMLEHTARNWLWRTEIVQRAFAAHGGPKTLVRYEDLRADPERHLPPLFDWMGLPLPAGRLAELIERHAFENIPADQRGEASFARAASPGLWRQNLSEHEQAVLHEIMGAKLRELGYEEAQAADGATASRGNIPT